MMLYLYVICDVISLGHVTQRLLLAKAYKYIYILSETLRKHDFTAFESVSYKITRIVITMTVKIFRTETRTYTPTCVDITKKSRER